MSDRLIYRTLFTGVMSSLLLCGHSTARTYAKFDPFGFNFTDFCDLNDGAPIAEACRSYLGGIVELEYGYVVLSPTAQREIGRACVPPGFKIAKIFEAIRPALRANVGLCAGLCTSDSYIIGALREVYPCPVQGK